MNHQGCWKVVEWQTRSAWISSFGLNLTITSINRLLRLKQYRVLTHLLLYEHVYAFYDDSLAIKSCIVTLMLWMLPFHKWRSPGIRYSIIYQSHPMSYNTRSDKNKYLPFYKISSKNVHVDCLHLIRIYSSDVIRVLVTRNEETVYVYGWSPTKTTLHPDFFI